jgi:hypothetical protein
LQGRRKVRWLLKEVAGRLNSSSRSHIQDRASPILRPAAVHRIQAAALIRLSSPRRKAKQ